VSEPAASTSGPLAAGTIHDLGYKRYAGVRQSTSTRWLVIARNQVASAWKTWWRFKSALGFAVILTFIAAGIMFLLQDRAVNGVRLPSGIAATLTDAALPRSMQWYSRAAFLLSLTIGSSVIARDIQSGAFTFYFARSVRPRDYVIGKLAGMFALTAAIMLAGPLVLAICRLALSESTDHLFELLPIIPKTIAIGLLGTLAFAAVPLGFSALIRNPRHAMALWAAYYLIIGGMMYVLSRVMKNGIGALDIATAIDALTFDWFNMVQQTGRSKRVDPTMALASLLVHAGAAISIVAYKVRRAHLEGIGGSS
jgi:ABC-type transport system involved in multi-copper enzyme maturation permease subunit